MTFIPRPGATIERPCGLMCFTCTCQDKKPNMERGIRHNQGKPQWSLIPMKALEPGVRVLMQGAEKYGTNNWRKGLLTREICESLLRHVYAYLDGEDNDSESGQPHVGHIIANSIFLSEMHQNRPDMDNRFSKEKACCGNWDEYGKCTCVDNREKKVFESSALREAKREVVCNSYHLKGHAAGREKEEPVVEGSDTLKIGQWSFCRDKSDNERPFKQAYQFNELVEGSKHKIGDKFSGSLWGCEFEFNVERIEVNKGGVIQTVYCTGTPKVVKEEPKGGRKGILSPNPNFDVKGFVDKRVMETLWRQFDEMPTEPIPQSMSARELQDLISLSKGRKVIFEYPIYITSDQHAKKGRAYPVVQL